MKIDLSGKTALVTGAGNGIGAGCARALADAGAFVWVNDLNAARAGAVAREIGGAALPGDVAEPGDWLNPALERGPLHVLVHNAGYDLDTRMGEMTEGPFRRLLEVQIVGPAFITQRVLPALRAADGATIVFIASVHSTTTEPGMAAYAAAKGGLVAMVNSLAQDLGKDKIRVVAVSPGYIDTPLMDQWLSKMPDPDEARERAASFHPLGRVGSPEDVGALVAFLSSPLAEFINGTNVFIDGGIRAQLYSGSQGVDAD